MRDYFFVGSVALMFGAIVCISFGQNIELVAETNISVAAEPTVGPESEQPTIILSKGDRVSVLSCTDTKHNIVPRVALPDGRVGYVIDGQFELTRKTLSFALDKPIVFSCP